MHGVFGTGCYEMRWRLLGDKERGGTNARHNASRRKARAPWTTEARPARTYFI